MRIVQFNSSEGEDLLSRSLGRLREHAPELTADNVISKNQRNGLLILLGVILLAGIFQARNTTIAILAVLTSVYLAVTVNRVLLFSRSRRPGTTMVISDEEALSVDPASLPEYTVLVPAYHEPEVIAQVIRNLEQLNYPEDRLDIKILLEEDDHETIRAARETNPPDYVELFLVPPGEPRTKPKALNAALQLSRGEIVTIYDAEDLPDPLQLRRAVIALSRCGPEVACLQAKLLFDNADQNLITKWFTLEYTMWFSLFLPGLSQLKAPIPLGGTSNHFRRNVLEELGAWDPFNVTEDADLGLRMARHGYRCAVLESVTYEEANSDFINWVKQRSRWHKGYLQSFIIHMRRPREYWNAVGSMGMLQMILFVGGTPLLALLNPFFWLLTAVWFVGHPHIIKELYPAPVFYVGTSCWIFGNFLVAYLTVLTCRLSRQERLLAAALLVPIYWVMMSIAAVKAFWQLVAAPNHWEKTTHGLGRVDASPAAPQSAQVA